MNALLIFTMLPAMLLNPEGQFDAEDPVVRQTGDIFIDAIEGAVEANLFSEADQCTPHQIQAAFSALARERANESEAEKALRPFFAHVADVMATNPGRKYVGIDPGWQGCKAIGKLSTFTHRFWMAEAADLFDTMLRGLIAERDRAFIERLDIPELVEAFDAAQAEKAERAAEAEAARKAGAPKALPAGEEDTNDD